jgi:hypothetical protein
MAREIAPVPTAWDVGWTPDLFRVFIRTEKNYFLCQDSNPEPSSPLPSLCTNNIVLIMYEVPLEKPKGIVEDNINVNPKYVAYRGWNGPTWLWTGTIGGLLRSRQ